MEKLGVGEREKHFLFPMQEMGAKTLEFPFLMVLRC
jgi:hypothetical protein